MGPDVKEIVGVVIKIAFFDPHEVIIRTLPAHPSAHPPFARSNQHSDSHPCIGVPCDPYRAPTEPLCEIQHQKGIRTNQDSNCESTKNQGCNVISFKQTNQDTG